MMLLDYKKLWDKGGYGRDNSYNRSMAYIEKVAAKEELHRDVTQAVVGEFFLELAAGKKYSLDKCPCGCGIDKSGTAATHALAQRIMVAGDRMREARGAIINAAINDKILEHMARENAAFTRQHLGGSRRSSGPVVLSLLFTALAAILIIGAVI